MQFEPVLVVRSHTQLAQQIEDAIVSGRFVRGQKLPTERELAESFRVSRGVVREAIKILDAMGLVESRQGSGIYVRNNPTPTISRALRLSVSPDEESVYSLFEFREPLEALAAECAALRCPDAGLEAIRQGAIATIEAAELEDFEAFGSADWHFHDLIGEASKNPYLNIILDATHDMQQEIARLICRLQTGSMVVAAGQHERIASAITDRNPEEASRAMREHISYSGNSLRDVLQTKAGQEQYEILSEKPRVTVRR